MEMQTANIITYRTLNIAHRIRCECPKRAVRCLPQPAFQRLLLRIADPQVPLTRDRDVPEGEDMVSETNDYLPETV